jgi:hypothetical protein
VWGQDFKRERIAWVGARGKGDRRLPVEEEVTMTRLKLVSLVTFLIYIVLRVVSNESVKHIIALR